MMVFTGAGGEREAQKDCGGEGRVLMMHVLCFDYPVHRAVWSG